MEYKGWTITQEWVGPYLMWVAIHHPNFDESGRWQIYEGTVEEVKAEIDLRELEDLETA